MGEPVCWHFAATIGKPSQHLLSIFEHLFGVLELCCPVSKLFILTGLVNVLDLYTPIGPEELQRHLITPIRQLKPHQPLWVQIL